MKQQLQNWFFVFQQQVPIPSKNSCGSIHEITASGVINSFKGVSLINCALSKVILWCIQPEKNWIMKAVKGQKVIWSLGVSNLVICFWAKLSVLVMQPCKSVPWLSPESNWAGPWIHWANRPFCPNSYHLKSTHFPIKLFQHVPNLVPACAPFNLCRSYPKWSYKLITINHY